MLQIYFKHKTNYKLSLHTKFKISIPEACTDFNRFIVDASNDFVETTISVIVPNETLYYMLNFSLNETTAKKKREEQGAVKLNLLRETGCDPGNCEFPLP